LFWSRLSSLILSTPNTLFAGLMWNDEYWAMYCEITWQPFIYMKLNDPAIACCHPPGGCKPMSRCVPGIRGDRPSLSYCVSFPENYYHNYNGRLPPVFMKRRLWIVTDMRVFAQRDYVLRMRLEVTTVLHRINIVDYQIYIALPFIKTEKNHHFNNFSTHCKRATVASSLQTRTSGVVLNLINKIYTRRNTLFCFHLFSFVIFDIKY